VTEGAVLAFASLMGSDGAEALGFALARSRGHERPALDKVNPDWSVRY